ncbi:MAG: hypothetical protein D6723_19600 [Acidobacteria bacterium]|nr:MAG: hypothetical protein D6723_19600 [Acidobacteriota bacterium]
MSVPVDARYRSNSSNRLEHHDRGLGMEFPGNDRQAKREAVESSEIHFHMEVTDGETEVDSR